MYVPSNSSQVPRPNELPWARYKAIAAAGSVTVGADNALSTEGNVITAAQALCDNFGWVGNMVYGQLAGGSYVFVMMGE